MNNYDLAIIGAGPVGLFATAFANLHGLKTVTFEALSKVGGQVQWLYPQKNIQDIAGYNSIAGNDLIKSLTSQAHEGTFITNYKVKNIKKIDNTFLIDDQYQVKSVLIASGLGAFRPKKFPLKLNPELEKHFHYFMTDSTIFANKKVAIFGGGDSALDWALQLAEVTNISIIHRRDQFRGLESSVNKLKSLKNVEFLTPYLPKDAIIEDNRLRLTFKKVGQQDETIQKSFDDALVAYGFKSDNLQLRKWGLTLKNGLLDVNQLMQTNINGIYAIGDVTTYTGRVPMIALGFGEAQIAITSIMNDLFPEKTMTIHSTSI